MSRCSEERTSANMWGPRSVCIADNQQRMHYDNCNATWRGQVTFQSMLPWLHSCRAADWEQWVALIHTVCLWHRRMFPAQDSEHSLHRPEVLQTSWSSPASSIYACASLCLSLFSEVKQIIKNQTKLKLLVNVQAERCLCHFQSLESCLQCTSCFLR